MTTPFTLAQIEEKRPDCYAVFMALTRDDNEPWKVVNALDKTDRKWDRAIQWLRQRGLVEYTKGWWQITDSGRELLKQYPRQKFTS